MPAIAEIDERAGGPVRAEGRVAVDQRHHPQRFGPENVAGGDDRIAADVVGGAAADIGDVADVLGVDIVVAEQRLDRPERAELAALRELPRLLPLRVMTHHEGFGDEDPVRRRL